MYWLLACLSLDIAGILAVAKDYNNRSEKRRK
jgi:hypothetical protein